MKKYVKYTIGFSGIGVLIGLAISLVFNYLNGSTIYYPSSPNFVNQFAHPLNSVTVSVILWMLIGCVFGFGSLIFELKNWSLLKKTIINFCAYYAGFAPLAILCGWFPLTWINFAIFTLIFIVIYAIIWSLNWYSIKKEIRSINQQIKKQFSLTFDCNRPGPIQQSY